MSLIDTPVLLITYKRPELLKRVLVPVMKAGVKKIYVASEAPANKLEEDKVYTVRKIIDQLAKSVEVRRKYAKNHQGCRKGVVSALDWVFENEERAIILEEDCVANESFFKFCERMLERYSDDPRVFHISGHGLNGNENKESYYFSRIPHIWGWASWKRAWKFYERRIDGLEKFLVEGFLDEWFEDEKVREMWRQPMRAVADGRLDTWDYQWTYTLWKHNGLAVTPNKKMVVNIGFDEAATHTKKRPSFVNWDSQEMGKIVHPKVIAPSKELDNMTGRMMAGLGNSDTLIAKIKRLIT